MSDRFLYQRLSTHASPPKRQSADAAGYDLVSAVETVVPARGKQLVVTDLVLHIPRGCYGRIAPRSGLAWKHSLDVGAGVIDADYRGNVGIILFNHSDLNFTGMFPLHITICHSLGLDSQSWRSNCSAHSGTNCDSGTRRSARV